MADRAIVPRDELQADRHQAALQRLAAAAQYLYDTMGGDHRSSEPTARSPLPLLATESVRDAQRAIDKAIKDGQRTRRSCLGGELVLVERWRPEYLATPTPQNEEGR